MPNFEKGKENESRKQTTFLLVAKERLNIYTHVVCTANTFWEVASTLIFEGFIHDRMTIFRYVHTVALFVLFSMFEIISAT